MPDEESKTTEECAKLDLNKTDVGQLSDTKLCLPDGENKTEPGELKKQLIMFCVLIPTL